MGMGVAGPGKGGKSPDCLFVFWLGVHFGLFFASPYFPPPPSIEVLLLSLFSRKNSVLKLVFYAGW